MQLILTLIRLCAMAGVMFTQRVKQSLASDSFPSRSSCLPFWRLASRRLKRNRVGEICRGAECRAHQAALVHSRLRERAEAKPGNCSSPLATPADPLRLQKRRNEGKILTLVEPFPLPVWTADCARQTPGLV